MTLEEWDVALALLVLLLGIGISLAAAKYEELKPENLQEPAK